MLPQINYLVTKLTLQAETWRPLKSHENDLVTFPLTCMFAVPELVGRLGECAAQQTVSWGTVFFSVLEASVSGVVLPRTTHDCCAHYFGQRVFSHSFPAVAKPNP